MIKENNEACNVTIENKDGITLTDNLFVKDLHISNCRNIVLPSNLHVVGNLTMEKCNNINFNEITQIDKDFILKDCEYISVPSTVKFNGSIKLNHVKFNKFKLPLLVKGNLYIQHTNIISLPDNLIINGDLLIENSHIKELPLNLRVCHSILIRNSNINRIKNGLICESLILPDNVVSFPNEYIVTDEIGGKYKTLDKLDFKKHPCNEIAIDDNGFFEHHIYEGYRANICMGLPVLIEKEKTHKWKMYDKKYMYVNGKIIEATS